jgi:hypothetical protein
VRTSCPQRRRSGLGYYIEPTASQFVMIDRGGIRVEGRDIVTRGP